MKKYIKKLALLCAFLVLGASCTNDAVLTTLQAVSFSGKVEASSSTIVLTADSTNDPVVVFSWPAVVYPVQAPVTYALQFDIPSAILGTTAWNNAIRVEVGEDALSKSLLGTDLNKIALALGLQSDIAGEIVVRVESNLDRRIYSEPITLTVTPFVKPVVFGAIYMPGSYQDFNIGTAAALDAISSGIYQGYVSFRDSKGLGFKFNTERNWNQFYGADANGNLQNMSDTDFQIAAAGSYQMTVNLNTLKWTASPYSWGIVGDATHEPTTDDANYGWNHSSKMTYDHQLKTWKFRGVLRAGNLKFRLNDSWTINYGAKNNDEGIMYLDNSGAHYIGEAGTYEITFTINDIDPANNGYPPTGTYTVTKI